MFDPFRDLEEAFDPTICAVLMLLHPLFNDPAGALYITATGDTYFLGEFIWDCPPYDFEPGLASRGLTIHVGPPLLLQFG